MSQTYPFRTLDVFTSTPYQGNQLAVITVPSSNPLSQAQKQSIASEFNLSESIFVHEPTSLPTDGNGDETPRVKVDIFTVESELPFAGHPTIGAIHHILTQVYPDRDRVVVDLKAGPAHGELDRESGFARAEIPQEFHQHGRAIRWDEVVGAQDGLAGGDGEVAKHALVSIVRGMNFGLVDLSAGGKGLLDRVKVTRDNVARKQDLDEGWPRTLMGTLFYARAPDRGDGIVRCDQRMIALGIEDPATGSASCALTAYLALEMGGEGAVHRFELVQGEKMGRRSVIGTEVTLDESGTKVKKMVLMGQCKAVMKGELEI